MMPEIPVPKPPRYLVGIDLGTTNCALAYVDTNEPEPRLRDFRIPQVIGPGEVDSRDVLPSFCYEAAQAEFSTLDLSAFGTPENRYVVGQFARKHGAQTPGRLVFSAKSWLCHPGVDRTAALLPWHGAADVTRISPIEATARYLQHLRCAWDSVFPSDPMAEQEVTVTVPASFDEAARQLTLQAAAKAGLPRIVLIEEPQAAFYAWMASTGTAAEHTIQSGQLTLICDVGGGTSDFTLIEARPSDDGGVRFHRVAVGDHLLLGGDNMDLTLAHHVEARLPGGGKLDPRRWGILVQACRQVKETLLGAHPPEQLSINIPGGARILGGALQVEVTRDEVFNLLVEGFFPKVAWDARPTSVRSGFQEFGLPYAADPAITKHLACFLASHAKSNQSGPGTPIAPDRILFNGGVFESPVLQARLLEVLNRWRCDILGAEAAPVQVLPNARLDLAVARGAAHAALLRRKGGRIKAGLARAYYVQAGAREGGKPVQVCLAPAGLEEGQSIILPRAFALLIRQPVEFALFSSSSRLNDKAGDIVEVAPEQLVSLPPVRTIVKSGRSGKAGTADVHLHADLTEIGTLDVRCVETSGNRSWKLEFDVRAQSHNQASQAGPSAGAQSAAVEEEVEMACAELIRRTFTCGDGGKIVEDPSLLVKKLEEATELGRSLWPLSLLRSLWDQLMEMESGRRLGVMHEARWLNLLGFSLRPGYGFTVDDWRIQQIWRLFYGGTVFPKNEMCSAEWLILWRRIAGGLSAGQQRALAEPHSCLFRVKGNKRPHRGSHETAEAWRLLGSFELLPVEFKMEIGRHLAERLKSKLDHSVQAAAWWALGRLGARVPSYGPLNTLVPVETVESWLQEVVTRPSVAEPALFAAVQMARYTGDRYRDLSDSVRNDVMDWLHRNKAPDHYGLLVREGGVLDADEEQAVFGESLPPGLHLLNE